MVQPSGRNAQESAPLKGCALELSRLKNAGLRLGGVMQRSIAGPKETVQPAFRARVMRHIKDSWRIVGPLRAICVVLRWLLRNARRALQLTWRLGKEQISRAPKGCDPLLQPLCASPPPSNDSRRCAPGGEKTRKARKAARNGVATDRDQRAISNPG
jgi:hypothetical protein